MRSIDEHAKIDKFVRLSKELNGESIVEREHWNNRVTEDAIRHFAYGTGDDNPLWLDKNYAINSDYGSRLAPPAFLTSILYPGLHGYPMEVPLTSLISGLEFNWYRPLYEEDTVQATAKQVDVKEYRSRLGLRLVDILAEFAYRNGRGEMVAEAHSTMSRLANSDRVLLANRETYRYSNKELRQIKLAQRLEQRTGSKPLTPEQIQVGYELPIFVRGPMTVGDLIAWQSAIGPSYRATILGFRDAEMFPHNSATHPITGWPYRISQQHEDAVLCLERGMPIPFDNTVMRFSWISSLLTNWIGDHGFLKSLQINAIEPVLYGDTSWYRGRIIRSDKSGNDLKLTVKLTGTNQLNQTITEGFAEVSLPKVKRAKREKIAKTTAHGSCSVNKNSFQYVFAENADKYAKKTAIIFNGHSLTYTDLASRSTLLSKRLIKRGVKAKSRVGVFFNRSLEAIIAALAVQKIQAVYIPLNVDYPADWLLKIFEELGIELLLSHSSTNFMVPKTDIPVIYVDEDFEFVEDVELPVAHDEYSDSAPAYIMYTSGTTGEQKAVEIARNSLDSYLHSLQKSLGLRATDVFLHSCAFNFSASIRQIFFPLYCGGTLVIADAEQRRNQDALLRLIKNCAVTIWDTVPTSVSFCTQYLKQSIDETRESLLENSLRVILVTGETLTWDVPSAWSIDFKHPARFVNLYSQTETTGSVCFFALPVRSQLSEGPVPIGVPFDDVSCYILDEFLDHVSPGETGDLYIGGVRVALEYVTDPWLSAQTFFRDPFSSDINSRLCKTGDRAILNSDGSILIVNRSDNQINYKGYKINPEEIEVALESIDFVEKAAVTLKFNHLKHQSLAGYVCVAEGKEFDRRQVFTLMREKLPEYMIPSAIIPLTEMPLGESGKLDRQSLPDLPTTKSSDIEQPTHEQDSELLTSVLTIWREVLELESLSPEASVFDLGMHSLHATQIVARIYERLGKRIGVADLFNYPTAKKLAMHLA